MPFFMDSLSASSVALNSRITLRSIQATWLQIASNLESLFLAQIHIALGVKLRRNSLILEDTKNIRGHQVTSVSTSTNQNKKFLAVTD